MYALRKRIAQLARTREDVDRILKELASSDWDVLLAAERRSEALDEEFRQSQIFHCGTCLQPFQRRDLRVIEGWKIDGQCRSCEDLIRKEHTYSCLVCSTSYVTDNDPASDMEICIQCELKYRLCSRIRSQRSRARTAGLSATLTIKQWLLTWNHFEQKCAYCQVKAGSIEHYLPISLGGGTTFGNCIPSCGRCNVRKRDRHPDTLDGLFPAENLARIRIYLASQREQAA